MWHFEVVLDHLPFLLAGVKITIAVTVLSMAIGLALGLGVALLRLAPFRAPQLLAGLYVDVVRSTPLLAQLIWVYFALPIILGFSLEPFVAGVLALGLYAAGYLAEVYRAGILSIAQGQRQAGLSLGMTGRQVLWRIILPQAVTRMLPPIGSQLITLFKESSLVSLISLHELMWQAQSLAAFTIRPIEVMTAAAVIYLLLTLPQAIVVNQLHRRYLVH
jgi:polar amino acid transport system permease protein